MARIKNGILGGFSGKIGTAVGYRLGNEDHIRSRPVRHAKFTANELANMAKFKLVQDHLSPLKEFLKVGFKDYGTKTGGYRSAVAYTRKHTITSDGNGFYIDPALFKVTGGNLPRALNPLAILEGAKHIRFTWDNTDVTYEYDHDQVMLLIYNVKAQQAITRIHNGNFRNSGEQTVEIPAGFKGKEVEVYLGFVSADRATQSDSQYLGKITIPK